LDIWVTCLSDAGDATVLDADVSLDDAPLVENNDVGNDEVSNLVGQALTLTHAITDHLPATKGDFLAINGMIFFDFDDEFSVGEA
jgi:hypothetical protein